MKIPMCEKGEKGRLLKAMWGLGGSMYKSKQSEKIVVEKDGLYRAEALCWISSRRPTIPCGHSGRRIRLSTRLGARTETT